MAEMNKKHRDGKPHKKGDGTCSAPTPQDLESVYWAHFKQFFSIEDGELVFADDTPERVLASYRLWKSNVNG